MYGVRSVPATFIPPCRPTVVATPPSGPGWAHELKHDGYRLQIHVREGRVRLYTRNGNDWTKRYPRIVEASDGFVIDCAAVQSIEICGAICRQMYDLGIKR